MMLLNGMMALIPLSALRGHRLGLLANSPAQPGLLSIEQSLFAVSPLPSCARAKKTQCPGG